MNSSTSNFKSFASMSLKLKRAIKIIVGLIAWVLLLWILRAFFYKGIRKNEAGEYYKMNQLFCDTIVSNTIFLGSSRCESQIIPRIFDSITGLSSYNAGLGGADLPISAMTLKSILSRSNYIQNVILSIDIHNRNGRNDVYNINRFLPYLVDPSLFIGLNQLDSRIKYMKYMPFYSLPFMHDNLLYASYTGYVGHKTAFDLSYQDGFVPLLHTKNNELSFEVAKMSYSIPTNKDEDALEEIIELCKSRNIVLIITIAPLNKKSNNFLMNKLWILELLEKKSKKNGIKMFNYLDNPLCDSSQLFIDGSHLNAEGAILFSNQLGNDLKDFMN